MKMKNKLFKFDWKISMIRIIIGLLLSIVSTCIIIGYNWLYDINHVLLFLMVAISWTAWCTLDR